MLTLDRCLHRVYHAGLHCTPPSDQLDQPALGVLGAVDVLLRRREVLVAEQLLDQQF